MSAKEQLQGCSRQVLEQAAGIAEADARSFIRSRAEILRNFTASMSIGVQVGDLDVAVNSVGISGNFIGFAADGTTARGNTQSGAASIAERLMS